MRVMDVALFIFVFNIAMGMTNFIIAIPNPTNLGLSYITPMSPPAISNPSNPQGTGVTPTEFSEQLKGNVTGIGGAIQGLVTAATAVFSFFNTMWAGFIFAISTISSFVYNIVFGVKAFLDLMLAPFSIPNLWIFTGAIQGCVWLIYGIGLAQWYSGRGFKEYM